MPFMTCQWSTQIFPLPSLRWQWSRSITSPTCHANDQDHSVLFPWDVSDLSQSGAFHDMPVIYSSFRFLPWDVIISDQLELLPDMLVIKIIQFSSLRCQWSNAFHDMPVIYTDLFLPFPEMSVITDQLTCYAKDQDHSVPEMSVIECHSWHASDLHRSFRYLLWDVSDLNQSDALHGTPVIYRSYRSLLWDARDLIQSVAFQWSTDLSVPFSKMPGI